MSLQMTKCIKYKVLYLTYYHKHLINISLQFWKLTCSFLNHAVFFMCQLCKKKLISPPIFLFRYIRPYMMLIVFCHRKSTPNSRHLLVSSLYTIIVRGFFRKKPTLIYVSSEMILPIWWTFKWHWHFSLYHCRLPNLPL